MGTFPSGAILLFSRPFKKPQVSSLNLPGGVDCHLGDGQGMARFPQWCFMLHVFERTLSLADPEALADWREMTAEHRSDNYNRFLFRASAKGRADGR